MSNVEISKGLVCLEEEHNGFPSNHELYRQTFVFEITDPRITENDVNQVRGEPWFRLDRVYFEKDGKRYFREEHVND